MEHHVPPDEQLAEETQRGNKQAFNTLVERYENKIVRYGTKFLYNYDDVIDAVQDVFLRAYTNIQSFDTTRKFSTWLYRVAHNTFINIIKKKGREPVHFFDFDTFMQFSHPSPISLEEDLLVAEDNTELAKQLAALGPKYREPLVLYYFEDKTYEEIADIMHIPIATVGVRLKRARDMLRKTIDITYGK